jgi:hypothetical protein
MRKIVSSVLLAFALIQVTGCTGGGALPEDPKRRLTEYISRSFAVKNADDRKGLLVLLSGEAKTRLASWSEEQFRQAFMDSKRQFIKLAFKEVKNVSASEVNITYELTYLDNARGKDAKVTNKKLAQLNLDKNKWYITAVRNIKELVEYRNEMALP